MKYKFVTYFAVFVIIHLTNAAPPFDVNLFLDELTSIHIRLGDLLQRTRYEIQENLANEPGSVIENTNDHQFENTIQAVVNEVNPAEGNFDEPQPHLQQVGNENFKPYDQIDDNVENSSIQSHNLLNRSVGLSQDHEPKPNDFGSEVETKPEDINTENNEKSVGYALDVIGNQWKDWFGEEKDVNAKEDNLQNSGDETAPNDEFTQSQLIDLTDQENVNEDEINQDNVNQEKVNKEDIDNHEEDEEQSIPVTVTDHANDWGEETNNNEGEVDEDGGWFGNAIDSIVDFFS